MPTELKEIWLICEACGREFDCDLDTAREIWDAEEQGVPVTCGNCDACAAEKQQRREEAKENHDTEKIH